MKVIHAARNRGAQLMLLGLLPLAVHAADQSVRHYGSAQMAEAIPMPLVKPISTHGYSARKPHPDAWASGARIWSPARSISPRLHAIRSVRWRRARRAVGLSRCRRSMPPVTLTWRPMD